MRVSRTNNASGTLPRRERSPQSEVACLGCRVVDPEHGLDHRGLCVECRLELEVAHVAVTRLIDSGTGVSRAAVEAL